MADQSHTPWFAVCADDDPAWRVRGEEGVLVADLEASDFSVQRDEEHARLIAAAPELLEALVEMEREKSDYMTRNNLGDPAKEHTNKIARAAIKKATGEPR